MAYTEIKENGKAKYYYRVRSVREGEKFRKIRIYLGRDLSVSELKIKEVEADRKLNYSEGMTKALSSIIPKIISVLKRNNVSRAGIFGSYASGKQKKGSDIDILVEPPKGIGFGFAGIQIELERKLKKKVDLVSYNSLSPYLRERILRSEVRII